MGNEFVTVERLGNELRKVSQFTHRRFQSFMALLHGRNDDFIQPVGLHNPPFGVGTTKEMESIHAHFCSLFHHPFYPVDMLCRRYRQVDFAVPGALPGLGADNVDETLRMLAAATGHRRTLVEVSTAVGRPQLIALPDTENTKGMGGIVSTQGMGRSGLGRIKEMSFFHIRDVLGTKIRFFYEIISPYRKNR